MSETNKETNNETENKVKKTETLVGMKITSPSEKDPVKDDLGSALVKVPQELEKEQSHTSEKHTVSAKIQVPYENELGEISLNESQEARVNVPDEYANKKMVEKSDDEIEI